MSARVAYFSGWLRASTNELQSALLQAEQCQLATTAANCRSAFCRIAQAHEGTSQEGRAQAREERPKSWGIVEDYEGPEAVAR